MYKNILNKNKGVKAIKWDQHFDLEGNFKISNIKIEGVVDSYSFLNKIKEFSVELSESSEILLDEFGNQVSVKVDRDSIEIEENFNID